MTRMASAGYRPALVMTYQTTRLWIAVAGMVTGAGIGAFLRWPYGWWISVCAIPELLHALSQRRGRGGNVLGSLFTTATVIGVVGLIVRLPSYAGVSLAFMVVASVVLLPPRAFGMVIGYQAAWAAGVVWLHAVAGPLPMNLAQRNWLDGLAIGFFTISTFALLWVIMRELDLLDQLRTHLLSTVSHELRTPLTGVLGMGMILQEQRDQLDPTISELVDHIVQEGSEAAAIVEDLLAAIRSTAGRLETTPQTFSVIEELDRLQGVLSPEFTSRMTVLGEAMVTAWADPARFRQIIRNLLTNAQRYGGDQVEVRIRRDDTQVKVVVADNGKGISPTEWETVFEPFRRASGTRTNAESMGLGLPISRALARIMGGDLTYRYEDGESRFELSLPATADETKLVKAQT